MNLSQRFFIRLIKIYQAIPGFWHNCCRFEPTCSNYMMEAIIKHGTRKGLILGLKRLFRCRPFGGYGYDPVPEKRKESD